ncbi:MAG: rod shape-determining protein MreD [Proteobacteria bacterium]|nr:rod shape-determining protein MreD [Pseudomonadota bacterium]
MNPSLSQRLDLLARNVLPAMLGVFLVLLSTIPFYIPGYGPMAANLVLMAVFYWAVHRPDLLSPFTVFLIGLLQDILVGMPPGMNAFVLLLVRTIAVSQGRVFRGRSFIILWWGFGMVAMASAFVVWGLSAVYVFSLIDPLPGLFQAGVTTALFPFLAGLFTWMQVKLLSQV